MTRHNNSNQGASTQIRQSASELRDAASDAVHSVKKMGTQCRTLAEEQIHGLRDSANDYYAQGRERASDVKHRLEGTIREKPLRSTLIAAGIGLLAGMFWMRR